MLAFAVKGFLVDWVDFGIRKYIFEVNMLLVGDWRLMLCLYRLYHSTVFNGVYSLWSYKDMSSVAFVGSNVYQPPEQMSALFIAIIALFVIKDSR